MSRLQALAKRLRDLKCERDDVAEQKVAYDYDANRAVASLVQLNEIVEKATAPDIRSRSQNEEKESAPSQENFTNPQEISETSEEAASIPTWARKTYRQIALKTHPDKVNTNAALSEFERDNLVSLYREATSAFREGKYETLIEVAAELGIEVEVPEADMESAFERKIISLRNEIQNMQKTLSWVWGVSFGDSAVRVKALKQMCTLLNLQIPEEKVLIEIIKELESQQDFSIIDKLGNVRRIKAGADRRKPGTRPVKRIRQSE
jgi:hypothetical protein